MKKLMFVVFIFIIGCSAKQIVHYQKEDCVSRNMTYQVIQDENYKVIGVKCIPKSELEEIK